MILEIYIIERFSLNIKVVFYQGNTIFCVFLNWRFFLTVWIIYSIIQLKNCLFIVENKTLMICNFLRCKDGTIQPTYNTGKNINPLGFFLISQNIWTTEDVRCMPMRQHHYICIKTNFNKNTELQGKFRKGESIKKSKKKIKRSAMATNKTIHEA